MELGFILLHQCLPEGPRLTSLIVIKIKFMPCTVFDNNGPGWPEIQEAGLMSILPILLHLFLQYHEHYTCIWRAKGCWMMFCRASYSFTKLFPNMLIIARKCQLINVFEILPHPAQTGAQDKHFPGKWETNFKFFYYLIKPNLSRPATHLNAFLWGGGGRSLLLGMSCPVKSSCYLSALVQNCADLNHWPILKLLDSLSFSLVLLSLTFWGQGGRERYYPEILFILM